MTGPSLAEFNTEHELADGWTYIYGLYDPRNGELRYIGKSDRPRERLTNQINEKSPTHRCNWIQELITAGLRPEQAILDAVPVNTDWQTVERAYIAAAKRAGYRLTNGTDGGDGVAGLSDDARAKMATTWKGRRHRPESLLKIGAASRGRTHTAEYREYMRGIMRDREFTTEHRQRIREATQKLSDDQVREIRRRLATGERQRDIAVDFGIHQGSVSNIARGITYRDAPEETTR